MKIALIHDWVIELGGAEKCLQLFQQLYPQAPLYTLLYKDASLNALGFDLSQVKASCCKGPGLLKITVLTCLSIRMLSSNSI